MGIKRYYATKDNTITNAFKANLQTRGVSGNMGQSDILETFHIYAQATTSSSELSRILIEFDTTAINTDRSAELIPASGSVSFFLKMFDAEHSQTTPKDFTIEVQAVSQSWNEGLGLDMEEYSDLDASNYISASSGVPWAENSGRSTALIAVTSHGSIGNDETFQLVDASGVSTTYQFKAAIPFGSQPGGSAGGTVQLGFGGASSNANVASAIVASINATSNAGFTAKISDSGDTRVDVTQTTAGTIGDKTNTDSVNGVVVNDFTGGANVEGGSYVDNSEYIFTQSFDTGFEDLEVDVTHLVEDWIKGSAGGGLSNFGFGVKLTSSLETSTNSYYTKMFFARGSQFFHKRPVLEARFDDTKKDNRGDFFLSSSLVPGADNLMNLYLYNVVRGELKDIPAVGTNSLNVNIYSGTSAPVGNKITLPVGGGVVTNNDHNITASHVETGIYSCSFAYTSSAITTIFDVWHSGGIEYHTGSAIEVQTFDSKDYNFDQKYVSKVTNLRAVYDRNEKVRFRLYTRQKDWSPTIYTVANNEIETSIIDNTYYRFTRVSDNLEVIPFGTGSLNHTRLSYDASGSYFDLEMNLFDTDTVYELSFAYLINGSHVEQPERFRFRVE